MLVYKLSHNAVIQIVYNWHATWSTSFLYVASFSVTRIICLFPYLHPIRLTRPAKSMLVDDHFHALSCFYRISQYCHLSFASGSILHLLATGTQSLHLLSTSSRDFGLSSSSCICIYLDPHYWSHHQKRNINKQPALYIYIQLIIRHSIHTKSKILVLKLAF